MNCFHSHWSYGMTSTVISWKFTVGGYQSIPASSREGAAPGCRPSEAYELFIHVHTGARLRHWSHFSKGPVTSVTAQSVMRHEAE